MRTEVIADPDDGDKLIVARYGDAQHMRAVAEIAKAQHNEGLHGDSDFRVLGHYPAEVIDNYCMRMNISLQEFMRDARHPNALMRDPDLADFRVWKGAV